MPDKHGDFIWYELMTSDADAAQEFYASLLGWTISNPGNDGMDYREIQASDGDLVGGVLPLTSEMSANDARPSWMGYIKVEDVDRMAEAIVSAGGSNHLAPRDIAGVGRFALVADQQGAMFYVMKPSPPADDPDFSSKAFASTGPMVGHCAWNELATSDPDAALNFYHDLFGWEKVEEMDMGPTGTYTMLRHDFMMGGMMAKPDKMPVSVWTYYFRVSDIDAAVDTIKAKGGEIVVGPMEIPGGDFSVNAIDPQGAAFALVGARN